MARKSKKSGRKSKCRTVSSRGIVCSALRVIGLRPGFCKRRRCKK